ncbi:MAG: DUF504 domain-containing protein [Thiobacillaceae bacterium]|jgi:uncharacterized protein (UPF0248 family)|nr:DUF504 domain-containing protein [Thiobacillaceae bacterium]
MTPIHELLSRIRWDPAFGRGDFVLGYWDRIADEVVRVPLSDVRVEPGNHFALDILDVDGCCHSVPYHRVVEVWRDGVPIWRRPAPPR